MKDFLRKSDAYSWVYNQVPKEILKMAAVANADLYNGPLDSNYNFSEALKGIYDWASDFDWPEILDDEGYIQTLEDVEANNLQYYQVSMKDWGKAIFGKCWEYV